MQVQLCAHRGAVNEKTPENTLPAFSRAVRLGANAVELDVRRCKSGEIVVIHDKRVDRTTNGRGKVRQLTFSNLKRLDAGHGTRISTLDETLRHLKDSRPRGNSGKLTVFIELKAYGRPFLNGILKTLKKACAEYGYRPEQLPVITFHWWQLRWLRRHWSEVRTGANISHLFIYGDSLAQLAHSSRMQLVNLPYKLLSRELVGSLHDHGVQVSTWTVNKPSAIRRAVSYQVDYLMTDDIPTALAILKESDAA